MRLVLKPDTLLAERVELPSSIMLPETAKKNAVYLVRQSAYSDVAVGDKVLCTPKAGLGIRSNGNRYTLLDAGDILARLE